MIDVVVHGDAESVCDSIHGIEDGIAEELFPQVVPDVFGCAVPRTERPIGIGVFPDDLFADDGPDACPGPASAGIVDASEPGFILKEDP